MVNLVLIDDNIDDIEFIISTLLINTKYIIINSFNQSFSDIYLQIQSMHNLETIENISIIKHNDGIFFNILLDQQNIQDGYDNQYIINFKLFLVNLNKSFNTIFFDIITCNLYNNLWKQFIKIIDNNCNIHIRTSSTIIGNKGNWILDSDNVNLIGLYFTEDITNYKYSLMLAQHIIAIANNGDAYACGNNAYGQCGVDINTLPISATNTSKTIVKYLSKCVSISGKSFENITLGAFSSYAIMTDGTLYSCGYNVNGELGLGNTINKSSFTNVPLPSNKKAIKVSAGTNFMVLLLNDGSVYGCGLNSQGQLGQGNTTATNTNLLLITNGPAISVHCGHDFTFIVMTDGTLYCCGNNSEGQLGLGYSGAIETSLKAIDLYKPRFSYDKEVLQISCGYNHTVVLMRDGTMYAFGEAARGQQGIYSYIYQSAPLIIPDPTPVIITYASKVKSLHCGKYSTVVFMTDGTLWTCGGGYWQGQKYELTLLNHFEEAYLQATEYKMKTIVYPQMQFVTCTENNLYIILNNTLRSSGSGIFGQLSDPSYNFNDTSPGYDIIYDRGFINGNVVYLDPNASYSAKTANNFNYLASDLFYYKVGTYKTMLRHGYPLLYLLQFGIKLEEIYEDFMPITNDNFALYLRNNYREELNKAYYSGYFIGYTDAELVKYFTGNDLLSFGKKLYTLNMI